MTLQLEKKWKPDPLTNANDYGDVNATEIYHALQPLDRLASAMEKKWGVDRLYSLVNSDLAAKFGKAKGKLDKAIRSSDAKMVVKKSAVMMRAWKALDSAAEENQCKPIDGDIWVGQSEGGKKYAFVRDNAVRWAKYKDFKDYEIVTVEQAIRIIEGSNFVTTLEEIKNIFPKSTIKSIKGNFENDEIPF